MNRQMQIGEPAVEHETTRQIMDRLGVDTSWYDRARAKSPVHRPAGPPPLTDDHCGLTSIYFVDKHGNMFTTSSDGTPYEKVREDQQNERPYLCAHCGEQFEKYKGATAHYAKKS